MFEKRLEKKLEKSGKRAPAVVLTAKRGMMVSSSGVSGMADATSTWHTTVRVSPPGQPEFEAEVSGKFSTMSGIGPGAPMTVLYDPDDHAKIVFERGVAGALGTMASRIGGRVGGDSTAIEGALQDMLKNPGARAENNARMLEAMGLGGAAGVAPVAPVAPEESAVDQLGKLADLRDRGVLTEAEFAAEKARILGEPG